MDNSGAIVDNSGAVVDNSGAIVANSGTIVANSTIVVIVVGCNSRCELLPIGLSPVVLPS